MIWEVLDTTHGDVLAVYASRELASSRLAEHVSAHPEERDDLVIAPVDQDTGRVVGDFITADEIVAHGQAA